MLIDNLYGSILEIPAKAAMTYPQEKKEIAKPVKSGPNSVVHIRVFVRTILTTRGRDTCVQYFCS